MLRRMAGTNLTFSKIVATPTPNAWSQAYSAGSLFAAFSLQSINSSESSEENLGAIGKDLISTLESEFFTLENKDLESIKQAISTTVSKIKEDVSFSFVICFLNENVLYLYAIGGGKGILKRGEKIGTVIEGEDASNIKSASGYVQDKDIIILQTKPFQRIISSPTLASSLDKNTPAEITEELAPQVHDKSEGGASAIVLLYKEGVMTTEMPTEAELAAVQAISESIEEEKNHPEDPTTNENINNPTQDEKEETIEEITEQINELTSPISSSSTSTEIPPIQNPPPSNLEKSTDLDSQFIPPQKTRRKFSLKFGIGGFKKLSRSKKLILIVAIVLVILLLIISIFAITNQKNSNNEELFNAIYNEAKAKFEEGQSLKELNASLSQESLKQAQTVLEQNKDTFPEGSTEDQKIEDLLNQVNSLISGGGGESGETSTATEVDKSESQFLSVVIDNPSSTYFTQNEDFIYFLDSKGTNRLDKGNSEEDAIIKKSWDAEGGIGVFGSNVYVLDKDNGILKFIPSGESFSESNYFTSDEPDFSNASAMTIDGSIYVLNSNGSIQKFTKGASDDFTISGLEKPMSSPTRISTNEDWSNIYVLDKGNGRIVILDKSGKFVKAYSADIIKDARDFEIKETENIIYVLSNDKVYKLDMK